jgi:hypothetical protein
MGVTPDVVLHALLRLAKRDSRIRAVKPFVATASSPADVGQSAIAVFPTSPIRANATESSADSDRIALEIVVFADRARGADDSRALPRVVANPRNSACATRKKHDSAVPPKIFFRG